MMRMQTMPDFQFNSDKTAAMTLEIVSPAGWVTFFDPTLWEQIGWVRKDEPNLRLLIFIATKEGLAKWVKKPRSRRICRPLAWPLNRLAAITGKIFLKKMIQMAPLQNINDDGIYFTAHSCGMAAHIPGKAILCNYS